MDNALFAKLLGTPLPPANRLVGASILLPHEGGGYTELGILDPERIPDQAGRNGEGPHRALTFTSSEPHRFRKPDVKTAVDVIDPSSHMYSEADSLLTSIQAAHAQVAPGMPQGGNAIVGVTRTTSGPTAYVIPFDGAFDVEKFNKENPRKFVLTLIDDTLKSQRIIVDANHGIPDGAANAIKAATAFITRVRA